MAVAGTPVRHARSPPLATRLASCGFVVVSLDHPYESAVTELPDGRVVGTQKMLLPGERDRIRYMERQQVVRVADLRVVIDQLAYPDALSPPQRGGRSDASKVGAIGHSFGGAASIAAFLAGPLQGAAADVAATAARYPEVVGGAMSTPTCFFMPGRPAPS